MHDVKPNSAHIVHYVSAGKIVKPDGYNDVYERREKAERHGNKHGECNKNPKLCYAELFKERERKADERKVNKVLQHPCVYAPPKRFYHDEQSYGHYAYRAETEAVKGAKKRDEFNVRQNVQRPLYGL